MIGNISYLTNYEEIDGGFVAFGGNSKGGKITRKGKIRTVPRKDNMYSVDIKNVVPHGGLTCLFEKATSDESNLWHRRLGHKGKQHRASCKTKIVSSISQPLQMLHMDLFDPTFVKSLMKKMYCLVVTNDFSRFSWVFFLATKDETSEILKTFITGIENLIDLKVKVIKCDNGIEFKNKVMNQFCEMKGIKREFSVARTPQVMVIKPHKKTPYELFLGRKPALSFMRPFGCPVTILNIIDHLGKFDGKADEGFFVGYSTNIKAFKVFNRRTKIVEENLHVKFSENTPNIAGSGPNWLFDIDVLTKSINYKLVVIGNQYNGSTGTKAYDNVGKTRVETIPDKDYILLSLWTQDPLFSSSSKDSPGVGYKLSREEENKDAEDPGNEYSKVLSTEEPRVNQDKYASVNSTNNINTVSPTDNAAGIEDNVVDENIVYGCADNLNMPELEDINIFEDSNEDVFGADADLNNLESTFQVSPIPITRIHKNHPLQQVIGDLHSAPQTRRMTKNVCLWITYNNGRSSDLANFLERERV
nr:hypothetical protein [Tanacetum cinerariifolium]